MSKKSFVGLLAVVVLLAVLVACSGNGGNTPDRLVGGAATVNVGISDPPTCATPNGAYDAIYVTITDVKIHTSATAAPTDAGWVDLTPNLTPTQVNLLGTGDARCLLAMLKQGQTITPGTYQQVRVFLAADSQAAQISGNSCGAGVSNCVVIRQNGNPVTTPLVLSSETQTGIKIPSGQIAGGQFTVASDETKDFVIDFDACASIVTQGTQFRLKPVLHAGEVQSAATITGQLVDSVTQQAVVGKAIVSLQRKDANNIDRIVLQTTTDLSGNFTLCPVPVLPTGSSYDLVAVAFNTANSIQYATTVVTGITTSQTLAKIPMVAQVSPNTAPYTINGDVTTSKTGPLATPADVTISALQQVTATINGASTTWSVTVPIIVPTSLQQSAMINLATLANGCPANTDCATYTAAVPALWPNVGVPANSTWSFSQSGTSPVLYTMEGHAFVQGSGGTDNCTAPVVSVSKTTTNADLAATPGGTATAATIQFTGCQ